MTAVILQFRDYQSSKDLARMYSEQSPEQQALAVASAAFDFGMTIYESSFGYVAPEKDPA